MHTVIFFQFWDLAGNLLTNSARDFQFLSLVFLFCQVMLLWIDGLHACLGQMIKPPLVVNGELYYLDLNPTIQQKSFNFTLIFITQNHVKDHKIE